MYKKLFEFKIINKVMKSFCNTFTTFTGLLKFSERYCFLVLLLCNRISHEY